MTGVSFREIFARIRHHLCRGQRRYVECSRPTRASSWSVWKSRRRRDHRIAPPIAIRQKNTTRNPRSTVATSTELYDFLRLLWLGRTHVLPQGHGQVIRDNVDHVATKMLAQPEGSRWYALFPIPPKPRPKRCATACSNSARRVSRASSRTDECSNSRRPSPCSTSISPSPCLLSSTACPFRHQPPAHRRHRRDLLSRRRGGHF